MARIEADMEARRRRAERPLTTAERADLVRYQTIMVDRLKRMERQNRIRTAFGLTPVKAPGQE